MQNLKEYAMLKKIYTNDDFEEFPTHLNVSKIIDCIKGSKNMLQYIEQIGYVNFHMHLIKKNT